MVPILMCGIGQDLKCSEKLCWSSKMAVIVFFSKIHDITSPEKLARFLVPGMIFLLTNGP